jgi:hypothetical protein
LPFLGALSIPPLLGKHESDEPNHAAIDSTSRRKSLERHLGTLPVAVFALKWRLKGAYFGLFRVFSFTSNRTFATLSPAYKRAFLQRKPLCLHLYCCSWTKWLPKVRLQA